MYFAAIENKSQLCLKKDDRKRNDLKNDAFLSFAATFFFFGFIFYIHTNVNYSVILVLNFLIENCVIDILIVLCRLRDHAPVCTGVL